MSHRGPLTAVLTAVLGVTFGGVLVWLYQTKKKKKRLPSFQELADPLDAQGVAESADPCPQQPPPGLEREFKAVECQTQAPPAVPVPTSEQLLAVEPLMVSCEEEWQQLWPRVQKELAVVPVLGFDCEWVKADAVRTPPPPPPPVHGSGCSEALPSLTRCVPLQVSVKGRAASVSLLQMATYSGLCVLVRLQAFRTFPLSLTQVLQDPRVFKVGVGCYDDGKRLTRDYGLSLACTVDVRYLALRQKYSLGWFLYGFVGGVGR